MMRWKIELDQRSLLNILIGLRFAFESSESIQQKKHYARAYYDIYVQLVPALSEKWFKEYELVREL